jgi:hypothetical protein
MEKLVLPFDQKTWTGLEIIFGMAAIVILIIYRLPEKSIKIICGISAKKTIFFIFQIFFGISEKKSPKENFSRIVLTSFIFWCMVMRTAYQGKLFEFTTTALKKPEIKTLQDLQLRNFTLYTPDFMEGRKTNEHFQKVIKYFIINLLFQYFAKIMFRQGCLVIPIGTHRNVGQGAPFWRRGDSKHRTKRLIWLLFPVWQPLGSKHTATT